MIVVPRAVAIVAFVLFAASIVGLGVYGYVLLENPDELSEFELKMRREQFLYVAVLLATLVVGAFAVGAGRTVHLSRELDKLIDASRFGDYSPELGMRKLGRLGEKITLLYLNLDRLSEKKSRMISALTDLVEFLVQNTDLALLVTDVRGTVRYVSRIYAERFRTGRAEVLNADVRALFPDLPYSDIAHALDRTKRPVERDVRGRQVSFHPVLNRMRELTFVVCAFDPLRAAPTVSEIAREEPSRPGRVGALMQRVLKRRRPQPRSLTK